MALAVASSSTVVTANADNLTITKPTGVASGDLLVIVVGGHGDWGGGLFPTCSGFTNQVSQMGGISGINPSSSLVFLYRIADASDVSASDYTIAYGSTETLGAATMFRITGWTSGNPVFASSKTNYASGTTTVSVTETLTRATPQLLIMAGCSQYSTVRTSSTYQVTSGGANPTWTELQDVNFQVNNSGGASNKVHAVAYANTSELSDITNWGFVYSGATTATAAFLIVICEPLSATADVSHIDIVPTVIGLESTNSTAATISHLDTLPEMQGLTSQANNPTQWTTPNKPTTTWINTPK